MDKTYNFTAKQFYKYCLINSTESKFNSSFPSIPLDQQLPSGETFVGNAQNPNKVFTLTTTGWHYFYCGRPFHCLKGGVKARVFVFDKDVKDCPFHPNC